MRILVLNGPNLNMLGLREKEIYGSVSLKSIENILKKIAKDNDCEINFYQSNAEHHLIDAIHNSYDKKIDYIIFNPAAFTHTSIALRDALLAVKIPFYEIHISDIKSREEFRQISYFSDIAKKVYIGQGIDGYVNALKNALDIEE